MSDNAIIKVNIRPTTFFIIGGVLAIGLLFFLAFSAMNLWVGSEFGTSFWTALAGIIFFGLPSFRFLGVAINKPTALRMDKDGISGYYADPATWQEIDQINLVTDAKGRASLGFALHDPVGFRDEQSPWRRFTYWSNGRGCSHHVIIPYLTLGPGQAVKLLGQARQLKSAAER